MNARVERRRSIIAIPRFGEEIAPCFEYSATIAVFTVEGGVVVNQMDFRLTTKDPLDRVRLLRDQGVDTLICGGVERRVEQLITASGIRAISWVSGEVEQVLAQHLRGELVAGSARLGSRSTARIEQDRSARAVPSSRRALARRSKRSRPPR